MAGTRKCGRCDNGTIANYMHVLAGRCLACNGTGRITVHTKAEREAMKAAGIRRADLIRVLNARAAEIGRDAAHEVADGRDHLETNAPERHARLLDSLEAGRVDAVIAALRTYARENVYA